MNVILLALGVYQEEGGMQRFNQRVIRVLGNLVKKHLLENAFVISLWDSMDNKTSMNVVQFIGEGSHKFRMIYDFLRILRREKPQTIILGHILLLPLAFPGKLLSRKSRILLFVHGIEIMDKPSRIKKWLAKYCIDLFLPVSEYTGTQLVTNYQVPRTRMRIFGNAIDPIAPSGKIEASQTSQKPVLVSVSRLSIRSRHKNIDKVILALPSILEHFPNIEYFIIGDGDLRRELEQLTSALRLESHVHFMGWLDDAGKNPYLEKSDIFILPSVGEGFGIVFLEAWQFSKPVVTSNQGAAPEIIEDGKGGLCVEPDPSALAVAVIALLRDPGKRKQMGEFGYQKLQHNFLHLNFQKRLTDILLGSIDISV